MSSRKIKIFNRKSPGVVNEIDDILAPARMFEKSYGLAPFKIIAIEDDDTKANVLSAIAGGDISLDHTTIVILAVKPTITSKNLNDFFKDIISLKKVTAHSLRNSRKRIEGILQTNGNSWPSKQAHVALSILTSSAKKAGAELTVFDIHNNQLLDKLLDLEKQGFTGHIGVTLNLHPSAHSWMLLPENKN
jgi:hypothetical protein